MTAYGKADMLMDALGLNSEASDVAAHDAGPQPLRSRILFQIEYAEQTKYDLSISWGEFAHEGRAAFWENEGSALEEALESILNRDDPPLPGWYMADGFSAQYSRDHWGECDAVFDVDEIRPARWLDAKHFGYPLPWWPRLKLFLGINSLIPATFMEKK
jgi:hypothetical protein